MSRPNPLCPYCTHEMKRVTPLIFPGKGVQSFMCKNESCPAEGVALDVKFKEPVVEEKEFQAMFTVKCSDGSLDTADQQQAFLMDLVLTYQAATPSDNRQISVSLCTA